MKKIILQRILNGPDATIGTITGSDNLGPYFTLEDEGREVKVKGETRIPAGVYKVDFHKWLTPKTKTYLQKFPKFFTWHIEIKDIPGFDLVYFHVGNTDDDTAGCVLVGMQADLLGQYAIGNSTMAFSDFYQRVAEWLNAGEEVQLHVVDTSIGF